MQDQSTTLTVIPAHLETHSGKPSSQNPARVYIASLQSAESRRTMLHALNAIAEIAAPLSRLCVRSAAPPTGMYQRLSPARQFLR